MPVSQNDEPNDLCRRRPVVRSSELLMREVMGRRSTYNSPKYFKVPIFQIEPFQISEAIFQVRDSKDSDDNVLSMLDYTLVLLPLQAQSM
jgi:hypothetical protein